MIEMHAATHSTQIGRLFDADHFIATFESDVTLYEVFNSFTQYAHDAVIITEEAMSVGILTLKDMIRLLHKFENLFRPVREFMVSPIITFDSMQSIADVLEAINTLSCSKVVVKDEEKVIGIMDHNDLLSLCYAKIAPMIKGEFSLLHTILGLSEETEEELLKLATTDPLTGIGNRRLLEKVFQTHQLLAEKYHATSFLLIFDVDDFKPINDIYGHNIGDTVLKELTALVSISIRESDIFVRWGGEEFAILFRFSDSTAVLKIAENIRYRIDQHRFESVAHMTCSFGLAPVCFGESLETVIGRADKALYRAKNDGKNCVHVEIP